MKMDSSEQKVKHNLKLLSRVLQRVQNL